MANDVIRQTIINIGSGLQGSSFGMVGTLLPYPPDLQDGTYIYDLPNGNTLYLTIDTLSATGSGGTVTSIAASTGITLTPNPITATGTVGITNTAVTAGTYEFPQVTFNAQGQATAASSLGFIDTTFKNLAIGNGVIVSPASTAENTIFGNNAASGLTAGAFQNDIYGYLAGGALTAATQTTAFGAATLSTVTTASQNAAFGYSALFSLSSGIQNVACGNQAGSLVVTSTRCTFLGAATEFTSSALNLNNSTVIGANAQVGVSNAVILGDSCVVGIGTKIPAYALDLANIGTLSPIACGARFAATSHTPATPGNANDFVIFNNAGTPSWVDTGGTIHAFSTTTGTVTSVATSGFLTGGPITTTGTISIGNSTANTLLGFDGSGVAANITAGTGVSISAGVISATGSGGTVTSVTGTTNQINVATGTTTPVLSLSSTLLGPGTIAATTTIASYQGLGGFGAITLMLDGLSNPQIQFGSSAIIRHIGSVGFRVNDVWQGDADNTYTLGSANFRWSTLYTTTALIGVAANSATALVVANTSSVAVFTVDNSTPLITAASNTTINGKGTVNIYASIAGGTPGTLTLDGNNTTGSGIVNITGGNNATTPLSNNTVTVAGGGSNGGTLTLQGGTSGTAANNSIVCASTVTFQKGQIVERTATAISYSALVTDYIISVTSTAAARTITLPAAAAGNSGQVYVVKDETGGANTNNITVSVSGGGNIDGSASFVMAQSYASVSFFSNGTQWFTF